MRGAEAHLYVIEFEKSLAKFSKHPFQLAEIRLLVDEKTLDLMEHGRVGLVAVAAKGPARRNDANGRLLRQHSPDLNGARMGAQQHAGAVGLLMKIKGVVFLTRGMFRRY